eukprot:3936720-Rhodomonas_salina.1
MGSDVVGRTLVVPCMMSVEATSFARRKTAEVTSGRHGLPPGSGGNGIIRVQFSFHLRKGLDKAHVSTGSGTVDDRGSRNLVVV